MKKINNYWIDSNNNKWCSFLFTFKQAKKYSKSLINCRNCRNCKDCRNCNGAVGFTGTTTSLCCNR